MTFVASPGLGLAAGYVDADDYLDLVSVDNVNSSILLHRGGLYRLFLTAAQLAGLTLTPPAAFTGTMSIIATATASEASNGSQSSSSDSIDVDVTSL